ncbi:MAG: hypothetical protein ACPGXX_01705, partial [Planctomycetaceae bacterium]
FPKWHDLTLQGLSGTHRDTRKDMQSMSLCRFWGVRAIASAGPALRVWKILTILRTFSVLKVVSWPIAKDRRACPSCVSKFFENSH